MARIDWAFVCELAYFDRHERLCVVGIVKDFVIPQLPLALSQVMVVARCIDIQPMDEVDVEISVVAPRGGVATPASGLGVIIEVSGGYVLATLRDVPLLDEGNYGFRIALGNQAPVTVEVPILALGQSPEGETH